METELVKYHAACKAIAEARNIDEIKYIHDTSKAMLACAKIAKNKDMELDAAEIRLRAERKLGEIIRLQKETVGMNTGARGIGKSVVPKENRTPTLADAGIDKKLSSRAQKIEAVPVKIFEDKIKTLRETVKNEGEKVTIDLLKIGSKAHVGNNTGYYEWYTPCDIIESARECMGSIDLDPATSIKANEIVKANCIYTEKDNGIVQPWTGNIWLNPPYENKLITCFINKLNNEYLSGSVKQACIIVNNATETEWFNLLVKSSSMICFPDYRVKFYDVFNKHNSSPLQGQAIIYYGNDTSSFIKYFSKHGFIVKVLNDR